MAGIWNTESDELHAIHVDALNDAMDTGGEEDAGHSDGLEAQAEGYDDVDDRLDERFTREIEADLDAMHAQRRFETAWVDPAPTWDAELGFVPF